ncbi:acetolactate synthase small subunit [Microbacterium trichothecenolyticum]|uniref:Acetolactate synthase small subunit n=1 Tax=Microbacterium trichothecenolyticum TaxID=69370 RepID=A0ABU0TQT4_MICTR|nr:acetolactate synthase small subunit [Microbacterium trichothecenolyticum]MDQ1122020.1 acetolactate synthase small subunit [Microbacterium trichothecenolyticum]
MTSPFALLLVTMDADPATLGRVLGVLRQRNLRVVSATITTEDDRGRSWLTVHVDLGPLTMNMACKALNRVVGVHRVIGADTTATGELAVGRELAVLTATASMELFSLLVTSGARHARLLSRTRDELTIELTGTSSEIDATLARIGSEAIRQLARSGPVLLRAQAARAARAPERARRHRTA